MSTESKTMLLLNWALLLVAVLALIVGVLAIPSDRVQWIEQHAPDLGFLTVRIAMPWPIYAGMILISLFVGDRTRWFVENVRKLTSRKPEGIDGIPIREATAIGNSNEATTPSTPAVNKVSTSGDFIFLNERELQIFKAVIDNSHFEISEYADEVGMGYNQVGAWISRLRNYGLVDESNDYVWLTSMGKEYAIHAGIIK